MKYLAIDTSNAHVSVSVSDGERFFSETLALANGHSEATLPLIRRLLAESAVLPAQLSAIIYGQGPGAFTGLRIGCGIAQGLAVAYGLDLVPVPTLDVVAFQAGTDACIQVVMDARMDEVYTATYRCGQRCGEISLQSRAALVLPEEVTLIAGDCAEQFAHTGKAMLSLRPQAASYIALVQRGGYPAVLPEHAGLLYIRDKVALTAAEQHARKHG